MILAIAKLGQTRDHCSEVVRISHFQVFQEIPHRAGSRLCFIELYRKIHGGATSNLMYIGLATLSRLLALSWHRIVSGMLDNQLREISKG